MDMRMRPRFEISTRRFESFEHAVEQLTTRYKSLTSPECKVTLFYGQQLEIRVSDKERHLWSPQLKLWIENVDDHVRIRAIFGPESNVWTMFMAGYAVGGMLTLGGLMVWFSQLSLKGQDHWGLWILIAGVIVCGLVYGLSHAGRYFALDQMKSLYRATHEFCQDIT